MGEWGAVNRGRMDLDEGAELVLGQTGGFD